MKFQFSKLFFFSLLFSMAVLPSCVDTEFEEPPVTGTELEVTGNTSIADLKSLYIPGRLTVIETDVIVQGIVVGNDVQGNFFRSLIIQDSTAGIEVLINLTDAFNLFPLGREVAIDCKGLVLGEFNGIVQLGGYIIQEGGGEELGDIIDYNSRIYRGMLVGEPEPAVHTINSLGVNDISTLVQLQDVEFASFELGLTYADAFGRSTLNRTLQDCDGNEIVVRTSGFADFAIDTLPDGNGTLTAIFNVFGDTKQLFIRAADLDVDMAGTRCNAGTGEEELMTIRELRDVFADGGTEGPEDRKIRGVVISDNQNGNFDGRVAVVQDGTAGITIFFQGDHGFSLGEEIEVVVSGQELSLYNDLLQLDFINNDLATSNGMGDPVEPRVTTIGEVLDNAEAWESTLVQINGASISGSATFAGATTVNDGSGSMTMFTRNSATFASSALPAEPVDMTAIVSQFNDHQLVIRNLEDVGGETGGGGGDPEQISLAELRTLFESGAAAVPANRFINAVVISDVDANNTDFRNMVIQDETGGIVVRFADPHSFALGEEVEISVGGDELSEFNGLLQINDVDNADATSMGNGTLPEPRDATIQEILDNAEAWESTLVKVSDVSYTEGGTFSGAKTLDDGTATIATFTRSQATFSGSAVPDGAFTLTAMVSEFNSPQLTLRNLNDIQQ
ncbi:MAG: DUF5689 domain-containing protein [Phaeodactylibacter xiamenensis]|uniref:DUF5689 domain-containing protein n=1 Tax=Phaeodactylibacter xiamenensis TaxID=1524460 RepID=A0A098S1U1_9BACT|nr:DUF5689 domain-containing protein [Phaeodactylibacter xiamenensis]KGE86100.1 hypothetical protein IX84_23465 [Phaeodactylibacter xiamenensis]MCR9050440.1 DUF5689 domain-containing protein [bacterium]